VTIAVKSTTREITMQLLARKAQQSSNKLSEEVALERSRRRGNVEERCEVKAEIFSFLDTTKYPLVCELP
jgi:hypothetical protein